MPVPVPANARRRTAALGVAAAVAAAVPVAASAAGSVGGGGGRTVVVTDADGDVLARVPVGGRFAVSYRNSIYRTVAEERYVVLPGSRFRLEQIAADQLAVLEEYYAVPGRPHRADEDDRRSWVVSPDPARTLVLDRLSIAATDLGERTLHVPGEDAVPLWSLVAGDPTVVLDIEESR